MYVERALEKIASTRHVYEHVGVKTTSRHELIMSRRATSSAPPSSAKKTSAPLRDTVHPGTRAALWTWLVCRAVMWSAIVAPRVIADEPITREPLGTEAAGAPLWSALYHLCAALGGEWSGWVMAGMIECVVVAGAVGIYTFSRKDALPQTAERAVWWWLVCPLAALTLGEPSAWYLAAPLAAAALGAASCGRLVMAGALLAMASALRPEIALIAPGAAALGWRSQIPGKTPWWGAWFLGLGPIFATAASVFASFGLAGRGGISLRTLHPEALLGTEGLWRADQAVIGSWAAEHVPWVVGVIAAIALCAMGARWLKQSPSVWWCVALPCLIWPLCHDVTWAPIVMMAWAGAPLYVWASKTAEAPQKERACLLAMAACSWGALFWSAQPI